MLAAIVPAEPGVVAPASTRSVELIETTQPEPESRVSVTVVAMVALAGEPGTTTAAGAAIARC